MAEIAGLIAEFSPFHQGHRYILEKIREEKPDLLVCIISGYFCQRGLPSLLSPGQKTKKALEHGADLVLALPSLYTLQSAFYFAKAAVQSLSTVGVNVLYAGSESDDLPGLQTIADSMRDLAPDPSASLLHSLEKEYGKLESNDLLVICYLYWAKRHDMKVRLIRRNEAFESATSIRKRFFSKESLEKDEEDLHKDLIRLDFDSFYPFLRYLLLMEKESVLAESFLMEEGIEHRLQKAAQSEENGQAFLSACSSKTYTFSRIRRISFQLLLQNDKQLAWSHRDFYAAIPLGLNEKARIYLKEVKPEHYYPRGRDLPEYLRLLQSKAKTLYELALHGEIKESFPILFEGGTNKKEPA